MYDELREVIVIAAALSIVLLASAVAEYTEVYGEE